MYVERGMEEIVCLKMEMGLCEEEEREFDEFVLLCLHLRGRVFFFGGGGGVFGFGEKKITKKELIPLLGFKNYIY